MDHALTVLRVREANEGWARYVRQVVDRQYEGNQSALAEAIGVSPSTVTRWIDGATPTLAALHEIRDALGTPMVELLVAAGALKAPSDADGTVHEDRVVVTSIAEAIRSADDLIDEAKQHLLNQYELLRRLSPAAQPSPSVARGKKSPRRTTTPSDQPELRAVARGGDPADRAEVARIARRAREQYERGKERKKQ